MSILDGYDISVKAKQRTLLEVGKVTLEDSKVFAVIGPNGSGKSTLLRVMALLQTPQSGYVTFKGKKVTARDYIKVRRHMAVVFQEALLLDASVFDNVTLGLKIRGINPQDAKQKAKFWLERFKVSHLSQRWARALSGGEAQRVSLARAFALEPEVLFLDEPFANLDTPTREDLIEELYEVLHSTGITTFFVSHNFAEVSYLADRVMVLMQGKMAQQGTPKELKERPSSDELARIVGIKKRRSNDFTI
jgi:tungstate transport system ATP-binding protein